MRAIVLALLCVAGCQQPASAQSASERKIPRTWDEGELESWTIPAREPSAYTVHVPSSFYYNIPVAPIYKSYPIYHPEKEPPGYIEWLQKQEPQIVFDASKLHTDREWVAAGKLVFEDPRGSVPVGIFRDASWYQQVKIPLTSDGIVPGWRYVVRKRGILEAGSASCSACHSRVMPDGSLLNGPQTNYPAERDAAWDIPSQRNLQDARKYTSGLFGLVFSPGYKSFLVNETAELDVDQIAGIREAIPPGAVLRVGVSVSTPVKIADLVGVRDRRYLDLIARVQHRNIGDMMRYAAFDPGDVVFFSDRKTLPTEMPLRASGLSRFSDEQLFALALYIYSLQPPPNPNRPDKLAKRGQKVFEREGCAGCHTPPLYTNNKLTLAGDFEPPAEHRSRYDILPVRVGTDPRSAMQAMRGTGYYKVPSLKGVWYRGPFEHNASVATLEDWFDARRLRDDYVPTGFKGYGVKTRAVRGHEFGLKLSGEDKRALMSFLRTL
uniref:Cytochrome c domain-containing protein n=1 Tax=Solibacter usitatus (strain Ellin6076) TaxID=234267 RepID=Q01XA8_SOLUE